MERLEEIRKRSKGITGKMPDANKAEIHRRDCAALISLIDKYKERFERIERLTLFYDDNVRKEVYAIAIKALEKE